MAAGTTTSYRVVLPAAETEVSSSSTEVRLCPFTAVAAAAGALLAILVTPMVAVTAIVGVETEEGTVAAAVA